MFIMKYSFMYCSTSMDKWMTIPNMGYVIVSRYNVVLVCLSLKQNVTIFPFRTKPPTDVSSHRIICLGHVYGSHFVRVTTFRYHLNVYYLHYNVLNIFKTF